jgi:hypothetical protein
MYFIEFIIKKLTQKKNKAEHNPASNNEIQDYEGCEHIFMPIDSTNEILSCTKCGTLVKRSELKNKNFFIQDKFNKDFT